MLPCLVYVMLGTLPMTLDAGHGLYHPAHPAPDDSSICCASAVTSSLLLLLQGTWLSHAAMVKPLIPEGTSSSADISPGTIVWQTVLDNEQSGDHTQLPQPPPGM